LSATTAGALKALIESLGLSISAYHSQAPPGAKRPYITIDDEIALVADPLADGRADTGVETAQVDIWQDWKDASGAIVEIRTLAPAVRRGVDGAQLAAIGTSHAYICIFKHSLRQVEAEENIVHHALTVEVWRQV
jgi:hypothetical protein